MIKVTIGGTDFTAVLSSDPVITDQVNASCRILKFNVEQIKNPQLLVGYKAELFYNGVRWFIGDIKNHRITATGDIEYQVHDPLFFLSKNPDDYYYKNQTATQVIKALASKCGIKVSSLANTGAVFPYLYYPGALPEKIAIDTLARTKEANGKKFWFRYDPIKDGLILFERSIPAKLWAFQVGVNLLSASKTDSIEELCSTVKLVNRETGKVVTQTNADAQARYGKTQYFEEVNKDTKNVDGKAKDLLAKLSKITTTMGMAGVNPNGVMSQFFTGDAIYVEEPNTGMVGGYYIKNVAHTFKAKGLIELTFDLLNTPDLPAIQFEDANVKKKDKK